MSEVVYEPEDFYATLTVEDLARKFDVGERIVRGWIASGRIRGKKVGRRYFVTKAAIKEFLAEEAEVEED